MIDDTASGVKVTIPRYDLTSDADRIGPEVHERIARIAESGAFVLGATVAAFEAEFSRFQGVQHTVGVGSGTDALEFALRCVGVGSGDEVIVPVNTFYATAAAVVRIGAVPALVDCESDHLLIEPGAVSAAVGARTGAIMPVHLYGQMAAMEEMREIGARHGIPIVEDAAQAHGSSRRGIAAGAGGRAAGVSFHPHKNLAAWGDAGAVVTNDEDIAERARRLRQYGADAARAHVDMGWNSRLDTIQAAALLARLQHLEEGNERRRMIAERYTRHLSSVPEVRTPEVAQENVSNWHLYVVRIPDRDRVLRVMQEAGIGVSIDYATPIHLHPAFASLGYGAGAFPVAERAAGEIMSLPIYPSLTDSQQIRVVETLVEAL